MKKVLIWLLLIVIFTIGGAAIWMKLKVDEAPELIVDPGIPADLEIPDDIPLE